MRRRWGGRHLGGHAVEIEEELDGGGQPAAPPALREGRELRGVEGGGRTAHGAAADAAARDDARVGDGVFDRG